MRPTDPHARGRGAALIAAAVLAAAGPSAAAAASPGRRAAARPQPAVAVGTSAFPDGRWRLEGRRLTVRLAAPLLAGDGPATRVAVVRCADEVEPSAGLVADAVERRVRLRAGARVVTAVFARDLARRVNRCALEVQAEPPPAAVVADARMRLARGTPPGCAPGRRERVVFRTSGVVVTHVRGAARGASGWYDGYRACRLPGGRMQPVATLFSAGPGVREQRVAGFAHAGRWLAWAVARGVPVGWRDDLVVNLLDLRAAVRAAPTRFAAGGPRPVALTRLTVARNGAVAWVQRSGDAGDGEAEQQLRVGWHHGAERTVDGWRGPAAEEPANAITRPAFGSGGRTLTWRRAGAVRRALLASPAPGARGAPPAIAVGASRRPAARFRLAGRELTVALGRRLAPRGFRGRPSVRIVCGDAVRDPAAIRSLDWQLLADSAERLLRVRPDARVIRARLSADIAARANWCGLRWRSRAGNHGIHAVMRLHRGTPPACAPTVREHVVAETDAVLVTRVDSRPTGRDAQETAVRACAKATRTRHPLAVGGRQLGSGVEIRVLAAAGGWIALAEQAWDKYYSVRPCRFRLVDAGGARARRFDVPVVPAGEDPRGRCPHAAAVSPSGRLAWIVRDDHLRVLATGPDRVLARTPDGRAVALADGPALALDGLAVEPDGRTASWREHGTPRSAPLP